MKKILAIVLAALMLVAFVGCGNDTVETEAPETNAPETNAPETNAPETEAPETEEGFEDFEPVEVPANSATDVLNGVWATYPEEEKFFAMGGYNEYMNMSGAGVMPTDDEDSLLSIQAMCVLPESVMASFDTVGILMHGMNANTFTAGCFKLVDGASAEDFAAAIAESVKNNQWICGFPETHTVISVEGHVISMFGNGEAIENFTQKTLAAYSSAVVVLTQAL